MGSSIYDFSKYNRNQNPPTRNSGRDSLPSIYDFGRFNPTLNDINRDAKPKSIGFWDMVNGVSKTLSLIPFMVGNDAEIEKSSLSDEDKYRLRNLKKSFKNVDGFLDALTNAGGDLSKIVTTKAGAGEFIGKVGTAFSEGIQQVKNDPIGVATGLPVGLLNMVAAPVTAMTGVDNITGELLNEEDRARAIKGSVALAAQTLITGGVGRAFNKAFPIAQNITTQGQLVEGAISNTVNNQLLAQVQRLAQTSYKKQIARNISQGIAKGTIGGSAYGLIEGANEDDQISSVINNGVIFGTLFSALDVLGTGKQVRHERLLDHTAKEIANWRKLAYQRQSSLLDIAQNVELIKNADSYVDAYVSGARTFGEDNPVIFEGLSEEGVNKLRNEVQYRNYVDTHSFFTRRNNNGTWDAGVLPRSLNQYRPELTFNDIGYFTNEVVIHNGKSYIINDAVLGPDSEYTHVMLTPIMETGKASIYLDKVPVSEIRRATQVEINDSKFKLRRLVDDADLRILQEPEIDGYVGGNVEELNKGYFYHGGSKQYGIADIDPGVTEVYSLLGPGLYTTRDPTLALDYSKGRGGVDDRTIYKMQYNLRKVLDAETPVADDVFDQAIKHLEENKHLAPKAIEETINELQADRAIFKADPDLATGNYFNLFGKIAGIADLFANQSDIYDYFHGWNQRLIHSGYDAITHIGGTRVGWKKPHQVVILLDPQNKYGIDQSKVNPNPIPSFEMKRNYNAAVKEDAPIRTEIIKGEERAGADVIKELAKDVYDKTIDIAPVVEEGAESAFYFALRKAMREKGLSYNPEHFDSIKIRVAKEVHDLLKEGLLGEDKDVINTLNKFYADRLDIGGFDDYVRMQALTNDFDIRHADGQFHLLDKESGEYIGSGNTMGEVVDFINKTRQKNSLTADPLGALPPNSIDIPPNDNGPLNDEPIFKTPTKLEQFFAQVNRVFKYHTNYEKLFESIDISSKGRTKFLTDSHLPLQRARQLENANRQPWLNKFQKLYNETAKKLTNDRRMIISGYLEAATPNEVISNTLGKPLSPEQIAAAHEFVRRGINEKNVLKFLKESQGIQDITQVQELQKKLNLDTPDGQIGIALLQGLQKLNPNPGSLLGVFRLIRSYGGSIENNANWTLSKADWAKKYKMTPQELHAAENIRKMFIDVSKELGMTDPDIVNHMISYANMYTDGNLKIALDDVGDKGFLSDLLGKTGEFNKPSKDPYVQLLKFINGGFNAKYFQPELKKAKANYLKNQAELKRMGEFSLRDNAKDYWNRYISDLRGWPDKYDITINDSIDKMGKAFGFDWDTNIKRDLVNTITKSLELGIQGGRVKAGILDFYTGTALSFARLGAKETGQIIKEGLKALPESELVKVGIVPGLDINVISDPAGNQGRISGGFQKVLDKVAGVGLRISGQKDIYNMFQQGAYLTGLKRAENALKQYTDHKDLGKLSKTAKLSEYGTPVENKFLELAQAGKHEEAAKLLATHTPKLLVPTYGNANNPYGWKNSFMRLGGQFGTYSSFARSTMQDLIARGTAQDRFARLARFSASQAFLIGLSAELGLNLSSWYFHKSVVPSLGPAAQTAYNVAQAVGGNPYQQSQAQDELLRTLAESPIYFPFGLMYRDIVEANKAYEQGRVDSPLNIRSLGIPLSKRDREWDEVLGEDALGFLPDSWFKEY